MESVEATILFSSKKEARAELKELRYQTSQLDFVSSLNEAIQNNILKLAQVLYPDKQSLTIASYMSFGTEVCPGQLDEWSKQSHKLCYPRVSEQGLKFYQASEINEFEKSSWGVMEPKTICSSVELSQIDIMLIPGLGFSRWGHRLGYGQGHYDKSIQSYYGPKVGINFKSQIIEQDHFFEPHDVAMDYVVTDEYILQVEKA